MSRITQALAFGLFSMTLVSLSNAQPAPSTRTTTARGGQFHACPLPIPNCIPEKVFDFRLCRCVERP